MSAYTLVGLAAIVVVGFGFLIYSICKAPVGYEDEKGFHEGKEPPSS